MIITETGRFPTVTENQVKGFFQQYRFLSNFHPVEIKVEGIIFPSTEHAYVAYKTQDLELKKYISTILKCSDVKKFGDTLKLREDWSHFRIAAMLDCLNKKFEHLELRQLLLDTGDKYLEETNNWGDEFYGVNHLTGVGLNMLGKLLMMVRGNIR